MLEKPIWSTWAKYGKNVDEENVKEFMIEIEKYNLPISQIEIDDKWTKEYGDFIVRLKLIN